MKTEYLKLLHERALSILDMIRDCNRRETSADIDLKRWDDSNWMDLIRVMAKREYFEKKVIKYSSIRQRLTKSYLSTMDKIQLAAMEYVERKELKEVSEQY